MPGDIKNGTTPFIRLMLYVLGGLLILSIGGGARYALSQSKDMGDHEARIKASERELEEHDELVHQIPVIEQKIVNLETNMNAGFERVLTAIDKIERAR